MVLVLHSWAHFPLLNSTSKDGKGSWLWFCILGLISLYSIPCGMILEVLVSSSGLDLLGVPWPLPKKKCICAQVLGQNFFQQAPMMKCWVSRIFLADVAHLPFTLLDIG